ncbi:MAG: CoA transferase subunit A [Clostridia bacterium]|nr:CoA transferase subunit A [Clostridia bacterium]
MAGKVVPLEEALDLVADGNTVGLGGMTLYRRPMAAVRGLIRRKVRDLTVVSFAGSIETDMLIGAGSVAKVRCCYLGMEFLGLAPNFRRAVEGGALEVVEETELTLGGALLASMQRSTFHAVRELLETDILKVRSDLKVTACPITGVPVVAIPALHLDVAIIHVQKADRYGNAQIVGQLCIDKQLAAVAQKVILTAEKIVDTEEIVNHPAKAQIVNFDVDAVVRVPFGAHPTSCYPYYTLDVPHLQEYVDCASAGQFDKYLEKYVWGAASHEEYMENVGGVRTVFLLLL